MGIFSENFTPETRVADTKNTSEVILPSNNHHSETSPVVPPIRHIVDHFSHREDGTMEVMVMHHKMHIHYLLGVEDERHIRKVIAASPEVAYEKPLASMPGDYKPEDMIGMDARLAMDDEVSDYVLQIEPHKDQYTQKEMD